MGLCSSYPSLLLWLLTLILTPNPTVSQLYEKTENNKTIIKVGYLVADMTSDFVDKKQARVISGAMTLAVNEVNMRKDILPDHEVRFIWNDTNFDVLNGTRALTYQWRVGAAAFFGPEDSCNVQARVAAAWNLPMISYKCADTQVSDKKLYPTFARTFPPATQVVKSFVALLLHYSWRKFTLVVGSSRKWQSIAAKIEDVSVDYNLTINGRFNFPEPLLEHDGNPFPDIVQNSYIDTRVYIYLGEHDGLQDMLRNLDLRGLLDTGHYVVIHHDIEGYNPANPKPLKFFRHTDRPVNAVTNMKAAQSLLVIVASPPSNPHYRNFTDAVNYYLERPPFNFPNPFYAFMSFMTKKVTRFAAYLYDAVYLYARAVDDVLREGGDFYDGRAIIAKILGKQYLSVQGNLAYINENGDAEGNFTVLSRLPYVSEHGNLSMIPVGHFQISRNDSADLPEFKLLDGRAILWVNGVPRDEPDCGYRGEYCIPPPNYTKEIVLGILGGILFIITVVCLIIYRNWRYEQEIAGLLWKINPDDIQGLNKTSSLYGSKATLGSNGSYDSRISLAQVFTVTGTYKGQVVALKKFTKRNLDIGRLEKKEMKLMRDLRHDNVNAFIGACADPSNFAIVTEYCAKGSLQDILENEDVKLDSMFIASLVMDLIKGMMFLHESELHTHGNLKSSNCVVNSRWSLQVADFGLIELRQTALEEENEYALFRNKLWTGPELLRLQSPPSRGTQKGDVYAFGIILYEILGRSGPFGDIDLSPKEIILRVKSTELWQPFRPDTTVICCQDYIKSCMIECWQEQPDGRPDFRCVRSRLKPMRQGMKTNIFDNMVAMMEKYQSHLEDIVAERTGLLLEEKKKTEGLLHRMLPKSVADQLVGGQGVQPESFRQTTIYFSDICGFTHLSAESSPLEVVDLLNDLYTLFDSIIAHYDVYKVETIGDAYMVVSGLPIRNGDNHAGEIASMSLSLLSAIKSFKIRHKPDETLKLRIGVHSGSCVAGVVGLTMPRYCLFGDTVNTASRMESNGQALKIHISSKCRDTLEKLGGYTLEPRGFVPMKGKGDVFTYWLESEDPVVRFQRMSAGRAQAENTPVTQVSERSGFSHRDSIKKSVRIADKKPPTSPETESFFDLIRDADSATSVRGKGLKRAPSLTGYRRRSHDGRAQEARSMSKEILGANGFLPRHGGKIQQNTSPSSRKKQNETAAKPPSLLPSIIVNNTRDDPDTEVPKETDRLLDNAGQCQDNDDQAPSNYQDLVDGNLNDLSDPVPETDGATTTTTTPGTNATTADTSCDKLVICLDDVNANDPTQSIPLSGTVEVTL